MTFIGSWEFDAAYNIRDVVIWNGSTYISISSASNINNQPDTSPTFWTILAQSGYSGYSGKSGYSGYSGISGYSGYSGVGISGYSGYSGNSTSGYSGYSSTSGYSGYSSTSGYSGYSGNFGGNSQSFKFNTATTAPPGTGLITFNNATYSSVSAIYIDNTNADGIDMSFWHGQPFYPAIISIYAQGNPTTYATFNVTFNTGNGYTTLTVTYLSGNGTFTNNQRIIVSYVRSGASGYSGYSGYSGISGYSGYSAATYQALEFYEPRPMLSNISTTALPTIGVWYVQSFSVPYPGIDSGRINNLASFGATSAILLNTPGGSSYASNTSGTRAVTYSHAETFALYSRGAGTNSTRMESFWANTWGVGLWQTVRVSTSNVSQFSVNVSVSIDIPATVGSDGNYTRQTFQASHAQAFAGSSTSAAVTSGFSSILNILSGALVQPIGFNTSLTPGNYWLAQAWSSSSTSSGSTIAGASVWPLIAKVGIPNINSTHTFRYFGSTVSTVGSLNIPGVGTHTGATASHTANMVFSNIRSSASNLGWYFNIMQLVAQST